MNSIFLYADMWVLGAICGLATASLLLPWYERRTKRKNATKRRLASREAHRRNRQEVADRLKGAKLVEGESGNVD